MENLSLKEKKKIIIKIVVSIILLIGVMLAGIFM